jgi:hypothetical protein
MFLRDVDIHRRVHTVPKPKIIVVIIIIIIIALEASNLKVFSVPF